MNVAKCLPIGLAIIVCVCPVSMAQVRIYNPANNVTFVPVSASDWATAEAASVAMGGHLASIHSFNQSISAWEVANNGEAWTGLNDINAPGSFQWSDGSPVDYGNWYTANPTNAYPGYSAALVSYGGSPVSPASWRTENTNVTVFGGVAEIPGNHAQAVGPNGHTYFLIGAGSWDDAEAEAVALGGHLAYISDAAENAFVLSLLPTHGAEVWIGLHDPQHNGTYQWTDGSPLVYSNWLGAPGLPGGDYVVHMIEGSGTWNDHLQNGGLPLLGVVEIVPEPCSSVLLLAGALTASLLARRWRATPALLLTGWFLIGSPVSGAVFNESPMYLSAPGGIARVDHGMITASLAWGPAENVGPGPYINGIIAVPNQVSFFGRVR